MRARFLLVISLEGGDAMNQKGADKFGLGHMSYSLKGQPLTFEIEKLRVESAGHYGALAFPLWATGEGDPKRDAPVRARGSDFTCGPWSTAFTGIRDNDVLFRNFAPSVPKPQCTSRAGLLFCCYGGGQIYDGSVWRGSH